MTAWANVLATGQGAFGFRLEIEGWPAEWVTDAAITHAAGADGRTVIPGLSYDTLRIRDRVIMQESTLTCDGIAFQIDPLYWVPESTAIHTEWTTYFLSREVGPWARLTGDVAHDATTMTFTGGGGFAEGDVIHIGTEAIRIGPSSSLAERAIWGTQPQSHPIGPDIGSDLYNVYIYRSQPVTMEGRRAYLHVYGEGDDMAGDGTIVWRGIVAAVPKLHDNGMSWVIDCDGITAVLNQNVGGAIAEAHPIGIYHHVNAPFAIRIHYDGSYHGVRHYTAHNMNEADMMVGITSELNSAIGDAGAGGFISDLQLVKLSDGQLAVKATRTAAAVEDFTLICGSVLLGFANSSIDQWSAPELSGAQVGHLWLNHASNALAPSGEFFLRLQQKHPEAISYDHGFDYGGAPASPLGLANWIIKHADRQTMWVADLDVFSPLPAWRIYIDVPLTGATSVYITGTNKANGLFDIADTGTDTDGGYTKYWIEILPTTGMTPTGLGGAVNPPHIDSFLGFLGSETTITAYRNYAIGGLPQFIAGLKTEARDHANNGSTPFVTDADLDDFDTTVPRAGPAWLRGYVFGRPKRLIDVLKEECKFLLHFLRIEADGRISIAPYPRWTEATPVDDLHTFGEDDILGSPIAFTPKWTPNKDGRSDTVEIQHYYEFRLDKHLDRPSVFVMQSAIPISKGRGKSASKITPYSAPLFFDQSAGNLKALEKIATEYLNLFAINYAVITIAVPYTKFDVMCGDVVSLTHPLILSGDGYKGVTGRRGIVIERRWNLDPRQHARGELTILLTGRNVVGYAPSAYLTDSTFISGNTWDLEMDSTDPLNVALATEADGSLGGQVIRHFAVGDYVRVQRRNTYTETNIVGQVTAIDLNTEMVRVAFTTTLTDGADIGTETSPEYILEFRVDTGSTATASQRRYAYVADSGSELLPDGTYARMLS
jgi:hypothetical protein